MVWIYFIIGKPTFMNGPRILPRNPPKLFLTAEFLTIISKPMNWMFAKALRGLQTFLSCISKFWGKLVSLVPIMFNDNHRDTSVAFFVTDFSLLRCNIDNFTFTLWYWVVFIIKVHLCRFENLRACFCSCKNNTLQISHS